MVQLVDIKDLAQGLSARIDELVVELLPSGKRAGPEWEIGSLHGEPGRSLKVHLTGAKAGVWRDFASGAGGDALELVAGVLYDGDKAKAIRWARRWLGFDMMDAAELQAQRDHLQRRAAEASARQEQEEQATREKAFGLWISAQADLSHTPVAAYLRGRGIALDALEHKPAAIRFAANCWNVESQSYWPAMLSAINRPGSKRLVAVHRTWLQVHPNGRVTKAPLQDAKRTLGTYKGGFISLSRGASGKRLAEITEPEIVAISEGIEDGLTVALAKPAWRVLCAVSLANMLNINLPAACQEIVLAGQNDAPGSPAAQTFLKVVDRFRHQGRRVRVVKPPEGIKDLNDLLRADPALPPTTTSEAI